MPTVRKNRTVEAHQTLYLPIWNNWKKIQMLLFYPWSLLLFFMIIQIPSIKYLLEFQALLKCKCLLKSHYKLSSNSFERGEYQKHREVPETANKGAPWSDFT